MISLQRRLPDASAATLSTLLPCRRTAYFVFFATMACAPTPAQIPYDHNPAAGRFYDINGFKMYTEVYGSGPPLLM